MKINKRNMHLILRLLLVTINISLFAINGTALAVVSAASKEIAVTFDDLPNRSLFETDKNNPTKQLTARHHKILRALKKYKITAVGFVNEKGLYNNCDGNKAEQNKPSQYNPDPARVAILQVWLDAGHELGNHTYSHLTLNRVDLDEYVADIIKGQRVFAPLMHKYGKTPRYFRHPFLHTGRSIFIHAALEKFLAQHGYIIAPPTIDTDDWMFNMVYSKAKQVGDHKKTQQLKNEYIKFTANKFDFYEAASQQMFGRSIKHIWLLHAIDIDADCLDELLQLVKDRGYKFITVAEALQDPVYKLKDTYTGPTGVAWLFHWDYSDKKIVDWKKEPIPSGEVREIAMMDKDQ